MVFAIGETIYDIIFRQGIPEAARAGGSMLNSAVSLGRCGLEVEMITEVGEDRIGVLIQEFLTANGVETFLVAPVQGFKTPVSLAFLDEQGNAHYSFYKDYPEKRLNIAWPEPLPEDMVLFGSFYSLDPAIRAEIVPFIRAAGDSGALVFYDPNIRKNHLKEIRKLMPYIGENIALSSIVRGSEEDFMNLFGINGSEEIYNSIRSLGCHCLLLTRGEEGVVLLTDSIRMQLPALETNVVSTIGAGDSFNAGIIYGLSRKGIKAQELSNVGERDWREIIGYGLEFAAEVCGGFENYISDRRARG